jgi:NitT/TauT family transport system ATP-binding protein
MADNFPFQAGMSSTPLLILDQIGKTFLNGTVALNRCDLSVMEGEFLSLLGPSGCGKSTVLRLIAGLAEPSSGRITWPVHDKAGTDAHADIGFVFQEPTLMPWASVFDNVWLPLRLKGIGRTEARDAIMDNLDLVGLSGFAQAYPRELSGGMKMRVSIARALVTRPRLMLLDEPFAALDEITRFKLNDDLQRIKVERGCSVIFVTHSVYESVYLSSRIIVMAARPGRVVRSLDIPQALPRGEAFRASALYIEACREASQALHGAMRAHDHL